MEQAAYIITPDARWLALRSPAYQEYVGYAEPDFDDVGYTVRNMGAIAIGFVDTTLAVALRLPLLAEAGLQSLALRLRQLPMVAVQIDVLTDRWRSEVYNSGVAAACRLDSLATCSESRREAGPKYRSEPLSLSSMMVQDNHPLRPVVQKWRTAFQRFDDTLLPFLADQGLLDRTIITAISDTGDPILSFIGPGFRFYGEDFPARATGRKIGDQPDKSYGEWVEETYRHAANQSEPTYETVQAAIRSPDGRLYRPSYSRLLLPWKTDQRRPVVTCVSVLDGVSAGKDNKAPGSTPFGSARP